MLTLALSKGRILEQSLPLMSSAGIELLEDPNSSRKLILPTNRADLRVVVIRAQDVPTFVEHGGADLGVAGKDVLLEYGGSGLYEPLDLGIARCRLVVAVPDGASAEPARPRVATKYERITRRYYAARGKQVEIIKLYGSMELAPLVGLADHIVDLVDSGRTLAANGLTPVDHIADISSWLVVNKASMKIQPAAVKALIADFARVLPPKALHAEPDATQVVNETSRPRAAGSVSD
jgi:ATP phosphoribosyltransferase